MLFKKKATEPIKPELKAVCSGEITEVAKLPDPVFSEKLLGDGYALSDPSENEVVSPVSGKVIDVQDTLHAYGIESEDGLQILVHIGINTVGLGGEGFKAKVKVGQKISAGQTLAIADFDFIRSKALPTDIVVLITNVEEISGFECNYGNAVKGETVALTYTK